MSAYRDTLPAEMRPRYDQAISRAAQILGEARARRDALPPREAAEAAFVPGGPSIDELTATITAMRATALAERRRSA